MIERATQSVNSQAIRKLLEGKKTRMKVCLAACASCSLCAESCFLYISNGRDPRYMPSYKVVNSLGILYRKKGKVSRADLEAMRDLVWHNCVLCGRCYCPFGIDIPYMISFARRICRSQGIYGVYPHSVGAPEDDTLQGGSPTGGADGEQS